MACRISLLHTTLFVLWSAAVLGAEPINSAKIGGKICYPSDRSPGMTVYARNVSTQQTFSVHVEMDANRYEIKIPIEGTYVFFVWTDPNVMGFPRMGATYSYAVPCGLNVSCKDHRPLPVVVRFTENLKDIDICDYYYPRDRIDELVPKP